MEVRSLFLKDFWLMLGGYMANQNREWDRTRHLMSYIASFSGYGAKDFVHPKQVMALPMDIEDEKKYITTLKQCLELINEFEESINGKIRS